jgi:pantoate--beta-alanine ligase
VTTVYLGLGSNLGDRQAHLERALARLEQVPGCAVRAVSQWRETAPVGGPPQGPYLNGAAHLETTLPAVALLAVLKEIEREAGRDLDAGRNQPRPIDLDILLYGDERIDSLVLQVPHPRLAERAFVREPLLELGVDPSRLQAAVRPALLDDPEAFAARCAAWIRGGCVTGLVPTMGALHEGHASLVRAARAECDRVAVTVFVNPLQFAAGEDFDAYPRTLEADLAILAREGADLVFAPARGAMYPEGASTRVSVGREAEGLESDSRPGHFVGVATVVAKLLHLAQPTLAFFGEKDAQQLAVIRRMVRDLDVRTGIRACPIVRAADGLALSSRNAYLTSADRAAATVLYRALQTARARFAAGERDPARLLAAAGAVLDGEPRCRVDYLELRREADLAPLPPGPIEDARLLVAAHFGEQGRRVVRLLDNLRLGAIEP